MTGWNLPMGIPAGEPFVDGIEARAGNYGNRLFDLKLDHPDGWDCDVCRDHAATREDSHMCFASLGEVSGEDLDRWVENGGRLVEWQFSDHNQTEEGRERWKEYLQLDAEAYTKRVAEREGKS